ncbi:MAG: sugar transferase [Bacteroidales bacterium]
MMLKRCFDIVCSILGLMIFSPLFIVIPVLIIFDSKGGAFYSSTRVGKDLRNFRIYKFRTMYSGSDKSSITIGERDPRITKIGYTLRKYKLDELPQLINVFAGNMSIVGPRPDVPAYFEYYLQYMPEYYEMKPGITSYSSVYFSDESKLYEKLSDAAKEYINKTIPKKVELDKKYYNHHNLLIDFSIIVMTIKRIFQGNNHV